MCIYWKAQLLLLLFSFREQVRHFMNSNKSLIFIYFDFGFCYFGMVVVVVLVDNHSIKHETAHTQDGVISLNKNLFVNVELCFCFCFCLKKGEKLLVVVIVAFCFSNKLFDLRKQKCVEDCSYVS